MRAATPDLQKRGVVAALAPFLPLLLVSLLLFVVSALALGCQGPCQRNSDCPSQYVCGPFGACEVENPITADPPDASDDRVHPLSDGALDDSDLGNLPDAGATPDAT